MQRMLCLAVLWAAGCGGDGLVDVRGQVTLDGQPLPQGVVRLNPADGKGPTAGVLVVAGEFQGRAFPGLKRVSITSPKVVGRHKAYDTADSPDIEDTVELIPSRYNAQSELTADVQGGGKPLTFDLVSKPTP